MDMCNRWLIVAELLHIEVVVILVLKLTLVLLPDRGHAVKSFDSLVYLRLFTLLIIMSMLDFHSDRESDVVRIFLYK